MKLANRANPALVSVAALVDSRVPAGQSPFDTESQQLEVEPYPSGLAAIGMRISKRFKVEVFLRTTRGKWRGAAGIDSILQRAVPHQADGFPIGQ